MVFQLIRFYEDRLGREITEAELEAVRTMHEEFQCPIGRGRTIMRKKILVVDDEPDFCEALGDFLEGMDYRVVKAYDADQAFAAYRRERFDVVLLDVRMPGRNGLELLREIRGFDPEARVVMITAVPEDELDERAAAEVEEGTLDFITKPLDPHSLERTLSILTRMGLLGRDE
jgi:DNA-binding NtrC family response regulator